MTTALQCASLLVFCFYTSAAAATCPALPVTLTNGTTANADDVMGDFNSILNCANSNLAPLSSPTFSGNLGIGTAATHTLDVNGNATIKGYSFVGSNAAPLNTQSGDFTSLRLSVGNHSITAHGAEDIAEVYGPLTGLSGTGAVMGVTASIAPTSDSLESFRAIWLSATYNTSSNLNGTGASAPVAAWFENRITTAGNISQMNGFTSYGLWVPSGAISLGTVAEVDAGFLAL